MSGRDVADIGLQAGNVVPMPLSPVTNSQSIDEPPIPTDDDLPVEYQTGRILDPGDPYTTAKKYVNDEHTVDGQRILHCYQGVSYRWNGTCYLPSDTAAIRAQLYPYLNESLCWISNGDGFKLRAFKPTRAKVDNVLDGVSAVTYVNSNIELPAWLTDVEDRLPPDELIACANGLLHVPTRKLIPHDPAFFNLNALNILYNPNAPSPILWTHFLRDLWPDDDETISALQEVFGYLLTSDTTQQKIVMMVGPRRSGKGTTARVLTELLGTPNVCAPTLAGLGTNFGLEPLIGKRCAIVADARLGKRTDKAVVAERLLSISGEDAITVDRKFRTSWTGKLDVRFLVLTNELPQISDASGALASRFIVLTLTRSFYGKEDHSLTQRLLAELPGILNWSLDGLDRLCARGRFTMPRSSRDAVEQLEDLASPVSAFVRDVCIVDAKFQTPCEDVWVAWKNWRDEQNFKPGNKTTFWRDLHAVVPSIRTRQQKDQHQDRRFRVLAGIGLSRDNVEGATI